MKCLISDCDGTIVNLYIDWEDLRKKLSQYLRKFEISSSMSPLSDEYNNSIRILKNKLPKYNFNKVRKTILKIMEEEEVKGKNKMKLIPGAQELLINVVNKYKFALFSSNGRKIIENAWKKYSLPKIDIVISREDVTYIKPNSEGLRKILNHLNIKPQDALFLGDSEIDIVTAKSMGMKIVFLKKKVQYSKLDATDYQITALKQLENILEKIRI